MIRSMSLVRPMQRRVGNVVLGQKSNTMSTVPKNWFERVFNVPKGWEKFYRKPGGGKAEPSETGHAAGKSGPKVENKPSGGGGNKGKKPDDDNKFGKLATSAAIAAAIMLLLSDVNTGREISWQDFQTQLLEGGHVDRIIVTNKNIARVVLRHPLVDPSTGIGGDPFNPTQDKYNSTPPFEQQQQTSQQWTKIDNSNAPGRMDARFNQSRAPINEYSDPSNEHSSTTTGTPAKYARYPSLGSPSPSTASSAYYFNIGTVETFERKLEEAQRSLGISSKDYIPVIYVSETSWTQEAIRFLPTLLMIGVMGYMMKGMAGGSGGSGGPGGIFKIGKSTAKKVNKETVTTTFNDVAGCDEAKREIMEFVQFLKDPKKFTDLGAKIPKGALLCGPPGTGKTLLAKATAGEANVPFYSVSGSDFVEMFVGVGPSRVRDLFKEARENAPCILFIDEIDAVGRQRGRGGATGGNDERENTLNALLVEMDGFDPSTNIVILAGTNRIDVLDQALTRPGRFDRQIQVDKPDIQGRKAIFDVYLKNITLDGPIDQYSGRLAALTPGFVGADIANICNEAAIVAARRDKKKVDMMDFESATERIIGGLESKKIMSMEERRVVAYHEAGHAVAGWNLEHADPLLKVTIVPRGNGALGFAQYLPKEIFLRTRDQILDMVCMALAGRASEQVNFGRVTTGAADDLRRVTQIVYQMVQVYGMNERVGQVAFPKEDGQWPQDRMYSNATAEVMDEEVRAMVDEAYKRTIALMTDRQEQVRLVAELLLKKETITNMDMADLLGKRPYSGGKEYDEYINSAWVAGKSDDDAGSGATAEKATEGEKKDKDDDVTPTLIPV